ncbi:hypothetical protein [Sphingomonas cavernae]|uniref:Uncharacterized protein n=1 Tax=Sphingomonas cavernae TaxID=2320861 RepID=A0A418WS47_9SPHN|nr:hypothetical protein [Sphingomonas cavernae]RJF94074.1 hypothetical protein D3876_07385 [Sphingomonas cavernae]
MGIAVDALLRVRSGLCDRIDRIATELPHLSLDQLCANIDDIRRTALDYGLDPVVQVARGLESALADSGRGAMVLPWLDTLRDAAGCECLDADAGSAYLAAINVRMTG